MEFTRTAFEALKSEGVTRAWEGIGGSHTLVTYPPLDALEPIPSAPVLSNMAGVRSVNLYVHLPFCEMSCAFCPYETQVMSGPHSNVDSYLDALAREMDLSSAEAFGTQLFRIQGSPQIDQTRTYYPEREGFPCELVKTVPFRANSAVAFLNAGAAHGADIPASAPETTERYSYQFYVSAEPTALAQVIGD